MNKCTESDIQEMLPDLLHRALPADARARVEAHLATCQECREDLEVLRTVSSAAVFAPKIDVDQVVGQVPPYRMIVPGVEHPVRTRVVSWLVAASLAVVVVGGGSLLLMQPKTGPSVAVYGPGSRVAIQSAPETVAPKIVKPNSPSPTKVTAAAHPHALALAADVDGLSDGSLVQLMNEMNRFDGLPASEPDPVISVDSGTNLEQDF
jgi:putative zinc finger protein